PRRWPRSSGVEHTSAGGTGPQAAVYSGTVSRLEGSELGGRVAIVTGGGQGIGRATALELARLGADVVVAELNAESAERTAKEVRNLGRKALALPTDVTKRSDLTRMVDSVRAELGRIDVLVNNAGIYRAALPLDVTEEHWDAIMTVNARAVFFASQAVLPVMISQRRGAIVNCVCPGFVETDMWTRVARDQGAVMGISAEEFTRRRAQTVPLGRMERPEDVAAVIGFLASDRAGYMTGQALSVDGGLVMHG